VEKNSSLWVEVTDQMFFESFMKQCIELGLDPKKEDKSEKVSETV
jgi:hypothetical protein